MKKASLNQTGADKPPKALLTRKQVAARWGVCSHTIARRTDLMAIRLGRRLVRYRLNDIEAIEAAAVK
jgi:hypothetical protein